MSYEHPDSPSVLVMTVTASLLFGLIILGFIGCAQHARTESESFGENVRRGAAQFTSAVGGDTYSCSYTRRALDDTRPHPCVVFRGSEMVHILCSPSAPGCVPDRGEEEAP